MEKEGQPADHKNDSQQKKEMLYSREEYGTKDFWEERYKKTEKTYFDWYAEFPQLKQTF